MTTANQIDAASTSPFFRSLLKAAERYNLHDVIPERTRRFWDILGTLEVVIQTAETAYVDCHAGLFGVSYYRVIRRRSHRWVHEDSRVTQNWS
jgi:hypothetical protein